MAMRMWSNIILQGLIQKVIFEACFEASIIVFLSIGIAKTHPTYIDKLTTQKKSYRDCVVIEYSINDIEEPTHSISCRQYISPASEKISNTKEKIQESTMQDSPIPAIITRESLDLSK